MKDRTRKKSIGGNTSVPKTSKPKTTEEDYPLVEANAFLKELGEMVGRFLAVEDLKPEPSHETSLVQLTLQDTLSIAS